MEEIRINIGGLDTLVTVQFCVIGRGDRGQKTYTYTDHSQVYAKVERISDEAVGSHNLEDRQSLTATIYKIAGLTTRWRMVIDGLAYDVTGVDPISRFSPLCLVTLTAIE